ncbi:MAG: SMC-Scp complex subunit ScpB [Albidovulum sp.]|nr:SMC-Scp complex subunit ScpB [Albidovulum sp.]MDE0531290.1 SMC-Scp complex subunit ScpB [Albidovulum sp.]
MVDKVSKEQKSYAPSEFEQERMVEAILFASTNPVSEREISDRMPEGCDVASAIARTVRNYEGRGLRVIKVDDAWAMRTAPDLSFLLHKERIRTRKLSRAALETLAIIAYHQPATRAEIEEIRGVGVSQGTLDQLLQLDWIGLGRRRKTPGRPVTFVVTRNFLDHFSLASVRDLPGLKELRDAGLLASTPNKDILEGIGVEPSEDDADEFE